MATGSLAARQHQAAPLLPSGADQSSGRCASAGEGGEFLWSPPETKWILFQMARGARHEIILCRPQLFAALNSLSVRRPRTPVCRFIFIVIALVAALLAPPKQHSFPVGYLRSTPLVVDLVQQPRETLRSIKSGAPMKAADRDTQRN